MALIGETRRSDEQTVRVGEEVFLLFSKHKIFKARFDPGATTHGRAVQLGEGRFLITMVFETNISHNYPGFNADIPCENTWITWKMKDVDKVEEALALGLHTENRVEDEAPTNATSEDLPHNGEEVYLLFNKHKLFKAKFNPGVTTYCRAIQNRAQDAPALPPAN